MINIPLAIIGCGGHAQHHARHLAPHFMVVTAWDPEPEMANQISSILPKAETLEALLTMDAVEAVMICSPDEFHLTQIEQALKAGKHVFCEKPLLVPGESIERLQAAFAFAEDNRLVLTSCHPRRYDKPIFWLRDRVCPQRDDPGFPARFGKVINFSFDFSYHKPANEWKYARSLLLDHANHEVDLMNALFGIQGFEAWKLHDGPDYYAVAGKREDGITFQFQGTRRLDSRTYPEWCRIRFERGEVALDMMMGLAYVIDHESGTTEMVPDLKIDYSGRLERVMKDFASQISDDSPGYLSRPEMLMNTEAGIVLQQEGLQRISVRP